MTVHIVSFGYGHNPPPDAHLTLDVRDLFRDPHINPRLRQMTGLDQTVIDHVLAQRGTQVFLYRLTNLAVSLTAVHPDPVIAIGCVGGRHRSVVLANQLGERLRNWRQIVHVTHRDITAPVLARSGGGS